jgi:hypothetical protein
MELNSGGALAERQQGSPQDIERVLGAYSTRNETSTEKRLMGVNGCVIGFKRLRSF